MAGKRPRSLDTWLPCLPSKNSNYSHEHAPLVPTWSYKPMSYWILLIVTFVALRITYMWTLALLIGGDHMWWLEVFYLRAKFRAVAKYPLVKPGVSLRLASSESRKYRLTFHTGFWAHSFYVSMICYVASPISPCKKQKLCIMKLFCWNKSMCSLLSSVEVLTRMPRVCCTCVVYCQCCLLLRLW